MGALAARGVTARAMSRKSKEGGVYGDLQKPETLGAAMAGVEAVFLATALAPDETNQGLAAVEAAKSAGVRRFVYMSVQDVEGAAAYLISPRSCRSSTRFGNRAWNGRFSSPTTFSKTTCNFGTRSPGMASTLCRQARTE